MSRRINDTQEHDVEPFDCVEGGEKYRAFRSRSLRFLACKTDKLLVVVPVVPVCGGANGVT